ncbi:DUF6220 domain-containing protein [Roseibium sp. LAB1]
MKMIKRHNTFEHLGAGIPWWYSFSARALPVGILGQYLTAGLALFRDGELWGLHAASGLVLTGFVGTLTGGSLLVARLGALGWWAGLTGMLYLIQILLSAGSRPELLAFHPFNGALLLMVSLVLLVKIEQRLGNAVSRKITP